MFVKLSSWCFCAIISILEKTTPKIGLLTEMLNSCKLKYTLSFCPNDEEYTRKSNELLKAIIKQLIIVSQNL